MKIDSDERYLFGTLKLRRIAFNAIGLVVVLIVVFGALSCTPLNAIRDHMKYVDNVLAVDTRVQKATFIADNDKGRIFHARAGKPAKAIVFWLHGTPGRWTEAGKLFSNTSLLNDVMLVSIDRPGWGGSLLASGRTLNRQEELQRYTSFESQTEVILPFIQSLSASYPDVPLIIAGHSWGASLAPYLAAQLPGDVDGLLLVSGAFDPQLAAPRWYHRLANTVLINSIVGEQLAKSNAEMLALPNGLRELDNQWRELADIPILVLQGGRDSLVAAENASYIGQRLVPGQANILIDENYGHLWHIERSELLASCLLDLVENNLTLCGDSFQQSMSPAG